MVSTHGDPQSGIAVVLWVGNRLAHSCFCPLVLPTPAPRPSSFPCPTDPGKHLPTPTSSQGSCLPLRGFSPRPHIGPFKGPYLPELLPTEGVLAFFLMGCSSVYPSHLTCKCEPPPPPICFPTHPHTHPLSWLSKLSAPLNSPAVEEYGVKAGPSEVGVRGVRGGGPGCGSGKEKEEKQGRERGRGRQPASRLYIPAVLIHHVTAWSVDSQREREGEKGGEVWGEGSRDPLVLGTSRASRVGCGSIFEPPPKRVMPCPPTSFWLRLSFSPGAPQSR